MKHSRIIPKIKIAPIAGYADLLAQNWDSLQECWSMEMPADVEARLNLAKEQAAQMHDKTPYSMFFGGEEFQIKNHGGEGGVKWIIQNPYFQFRLKSTRSKSGQVRQWGVTVRYMSAGIWEFGIEYMRGWAVQLFDFEGFKPLNGAATGEEEDIYSNLQAPNEWQRVTMAHYAFDLHSEAFSADMAGGRLRDGLVLPSGVKANVIFTKNGDETLTIGLKSKNLQVQVYDKGREIKQSSGKEWFCEVWERSNKWIAPDDPEEQIKDVWRVEIRLGKQFLKNRGIQTFFDLEKVFSELLTEALFKRRLCVPSKTEKDRKRWDLHPLWAEVYDNIGGYGEYVPIGRKTTMRADILIRMMDKQIAGLARTRTIIKGGGYDDEDAQLLLENIGDLIAMDTEHDKKCDEKREKYKHIRDANL